MPHGRCERSVWDAHTDVTARPRTRHRRHFTAGQEHRVAIVQRRLASALFGSGNTAPVHGQADVVVAVGDQPLGPPVTHAAKGARHDTESGQRAQTYVGVKRPIRQRLDVEPQDHLAIHLAPDADPVGLRQEVGRKMQRP
jgi:hypothetical protein